MTRLCALADVQVAGLHRGVVEDLVLYLYIPPLVVPLLQGQSYGIDHGPCLYAVRPLHWQVAHYLGRGAFSSAPLASASAAATDD